MHGTTPSLSHIMNSKFKKLGKYILELKKHKENLLKILLVQHTKLKPHSFNGAGITTNIGIPITLGLSDAKIENRKAKK